MLRVDLQLIKVVEHGRVLFIDAAEFCDASVEALLRIVCVGDNALGQVHDAGLEEIVGGVERDDELRHGGAIVDGHLAVFLLLFLFIDC